MIKNLQGSAGVSLRTIDALRGKSDKDPEAIKGVAKEMEALFANELIKSMRATTVGMSKESFGGATYMGMFDTELSRLFAERGLGLQEVFAKGLNKLAETAPTPPHVDPDTRATETFLPVSPKKDTVKVFP